MSSEEPDPNKFRSANLFEVNNDVFARTSEAPTGSISTAINECTIPNFVGLSVSDAEAQWASANFTTTLVKNPTSLTTITDQRPAAGVKGDCANIIAVVYDTSSNPDIAKDDTCVVPDLTGVTFSDAEKLGVGLNLKLL
ncbi:MAG: hypothetical protein HC796_11685 [Synechococcaceae cyanobacterium RL_1_2]|nr:hypothetical protein [Synechococcaceae cyanobacterium RL_1_2]